MINLEYVSAFIIGISLYFFVFEMQGVQTLLKSQSPDENHAKQALIKKQRLIAILV